MTSETKGYLCVATAAIMWASSGSAGRHIMDAGVLPTDLVQIRVTLASIILGAVFLLLSTNLFRVEWRDLPYLALLGGVVMAGVQFSYFYTISKIPVMAAILLQYMSPILVAFYSVLFWGERLTWAKVAALGLAFVGCFLVVGAYNIDLLRMNRDGVIGGLIAAVSYAAYALLGERVMQRYPPWTVVFYGLLFAAVSWHLIHPPFKYLYAPYTSAQWFWIVYIVIVGTILPFGLYFVGVNYIRATRAMITATLEPIAAGLMAAAFLGQIPAAPQILGAALVIAAITLLQLKREQDCLTPDMIRRQKEMCETPPPPR